MSSSIVKENPYFQHRMEDLCIICNKLLTNSCKYASDASTLEILPKIQPEMTLFEALKILSNFQALNIDADSLRACYTCFYNTEKALQFQIMCNNSVENIRAYIDHQAQVISGAVVVFDEDKVEEVVVTNSPEDEDVETEQEYQVVTKQEKLEETDEADRMEDFEEVLAENVVKRFFKVVQNQSKEVKIFPTTSEKKCVGRKEEVVTKKIIIKKVKTKTLNMPTSKNQCPICGKMVCKSYLKLHVKSHTEESTHKCTICGKCFIFSSALLFHERVHESDEQFLCSYCGISFRLKAQLLKHLQVHTDDRFRCDFSSCDKVFRTMRKKQEHESTHLSVKSIKAEAGKGKFACDECPKTFFVENVLIQHKAVHMQV